MCPFSDLDQTKNDSFSVRNQIPQQALSNPDFSDITPMPKEVFLKGLARRHEELLLETKPGEVLLSYDNGAVAHTVVVADGAVIHQRNSIGPSGQPLPAVAEPSVTYASFNEFWMAFTLEEKWWLQITKKRGPVHAVLLYPLVTHHNELLADIELTYADCRPLFDLIQFIPVAGFMLKHYLVQLCPNCRAQVRRFTARYPKRLCATCVKLPLHNTAGERLEFTYLGEWTGFRVKITSPRGNVREETHLHGLPFRLNGRNYRAGSERGGGAHYSVLEGQRNYLI